MYISPPLSTIFLLYLIYPLSTFLSPLGNPPLLSSLKSSLTHLDPIPYHTTNTIHLCYTSGSLLSLLSLPRSIIPGSIPHTIPLH